MTDRRATGLPTTEIHAATDRRATGLLTTGTHAVTDRRATGLLTTGMHAETDRRATGLLTTGTHAATDRRASAGEITAVSAVRMTKMHSRTGSSVRSSAPSAESPEKHLQLFKRKIVRLKTRTAMFAPSTPKRRQRTKRRS